MPKSRIKKKKTEKIICPDCARAMQRSKSHLGRALCEECKIAISVPIGVVVSCGKDQGKYVYLAEEILNELASDGNDRYTMKVEFEHELKNKDYVIIRWIDVE